MKNTRSNISNNVVSLIHANRHFGNFARGNWSEVRDFILFAAWSCLEYDGAFNLKHPTSFRARSLAIYEQPKILERRKIDFGISRFHYRHARLALFPYLKLYRSPRMILAGCPLTFRDCGLQFRRRMYRAVSWRDSALTLQELEAYRELPPEEEKREIERKKERERKRDKETLFPSKISQLSAFEKSTDYSTDFLPLKNKAGKSVFRYWKSKKCLYI